MQWRYALQASDAEAVGALVAATGFFSKAEEIIAVELIEERMARGLDSGYEFVLADDPQQTGRLLGYTCYGPIPATQSSFDLYWIAVSPQAQREGLGGRLLRESERLAKQQQATHMFVDTAGRAEYAPTRRFYERMGYHVAANISDFYAPGDAKVIYSRSLD
jgi:ribosomal protein S18 acetylase RimI-like enzyme